MSRFDRWHRPALACSLLLLAGTAAGGERITLNARLQGLYPHQARQGLYSVPDSILPRQRGYLRQEVELSGRKDGLNTTLTFRNHVPTGHGRSGQLLLNELYLERQPFGQELTLGKKITSLGVGFGFRPLDVLQQEQRLPLIPVTPEGVTQLAWEYYFADAALGLIWANPANGSADDPLQDESIVFRYYATDGATDLHGVARYSDRHGLQLGIGLSRISGDHLEWHGSLLWLQRYSRRINRLTLPGAPLLAPADPFVPRAFHGGIQGLAGASWTDDSGWTLLAEAWFDQTAYSGRQWRDLQRLTRAQRELLASPLPAAWIYGNIAYNLQAFDHDNLRQWNLLLRLSRQSSGLEPALTLLYTPGDGGWVATLKMRHEMDQQTLEAGARLFGGSGDAGYAQLPRERQFFFNWQTGF